MSTEHDTAPEQHWGIPLDVLDQVVAETLGASTVSRELLGGGLSQITFRYQADDRSVIVRIPPLHGPLEPYSPVGEGRLMTWLREQGLPAPHIMYSTADEPRIGRAYLISELVDGYVVRDGAPGADDTTRRDMAHTYVDALVQLHGVADLDRADEVLGWAPAKTAHGVVERWTDSLAKTSLDLPDFHRFLTDWLGEHMPAEDPHPTVVHGDYRLGNVMWRDPRHLAAILDWEEAGAGDPYFDLGWTLMGTDRPDDMMMGILRRDEFLDRYAGGLGVTIDPERLLWWEVAASWSRLCMEAKAIALLAEGHYTDLRPLLSSYINRRLSIILLEKIAAHDGQLPSALSS